MTNRDPIYEFAQGIPPQGMSRSFVNNVRLAIQAQMRTAIRTEQRTGRLYKRALLRPVLPPVDGGVWNSKIFYKREEQKKINTAVMVLVDVSGSMSGSKLVHASQATCLLTNCLARALRVPTEVLCFGYRCSNVCISEVKTFDQPCATDQQIAGSVYSAFAIGGSGNDDADALLFAYDRLIKRKEQKRILIVLSDGSPADSPNGSDPDNGLKQVADSIRSRRLVHLYGIGIMDTNVQRYYGTNAKVIRKADDLERVLVDTLRDSVFVNTR